MENINTEQMTFTEVRHLPIVKEYAKRLNLVETIDQMVNSQMELSPGIAVLAMVLDTLSGRTPLYRLTEFFEEKDVELLLGTAIEPARFCDTNLGRVMDQLFEVGTMKIFSQIAQNALVLAFYWRNTAVRKPCTLLDGRQNTVSFISLRRCDDLSRPDRA